MAINVDRSITAGINGFGRFGLGLFRAWFEDGGANYRIRFINDDSLSGQDIADILKQDPVVTAFNKLSIRYASGTLCVRRPDGKNVRIGVTTGGIEQCGWIGEPTIVFDSSSRAANFEKYRDFLSRRTRLVLIGATTPVADATLIMGYNEAAYVEDRDRIVSFGSCTVIPGVHVIHMMEELFGLENVLVTVVHSVPKWQLESGRWTSLARKTCTLESVAPMVIPSLREKDIKVNYTYAPFHGVSLMDFAFELRQPTVKEGVIQRVHSFLRQRGLERLIGFAPEDEGAAVFLDSEKSITLVGSSFDIRENRLYFFGYFNNEGSGIRLHELAKFIVSTWH